MRQIVQLLCRPEHRIHLEKGLIGAFKVISSCVHFSSDYKMGLIRGILAKYTRPQEAALIQVQNRMIFRFGFILD